MQRFALIAGFLGLLSLVAPAASQQNLLPQLSLDAAGACRQLSVRDRDSNALVPMGCLSAGKWRLPSSGLTTLPEGEATLGDAFASRQKVFRFDPRVYGATCNGSGTGDDKGINAAIAALQAAGGGTLHVPGKCVISRGKTVTGVPIVITGDGFGSSQLIGSASFTGGAPFLLRLDISGGSNLTATVTGVGFRTAQTEAVSALQIEGSVSGLEERAVVSDVEIRGTNVATAGFTYGLQLRNVNGPKVSRVTITGRQTGNGPSGLTNMTACIDVVNTIGSMTNYAFSDVRCNAAKLGWNMNGYIEGVLCTRCFAIAVGTGWRARPGAIVPLLNISQSHADFFDAGVDVEQMAQGFYTANLFYHRSDSTGPGICYQMSNNSKQSSIIGGECYNASNATSLTGVNWNNTSDSLVSDVIFRGLAAGVTNTNGSTNNIYRRGILTENAPTFGEHGNGGSNTNICIGYNAAC